MSSLDFWNQLPGEVPPTIHWAGEWVAPYLGLLLLWEIGECGIGWHEPVPPKKGLWSAPYQLVTWNGSYLSNWASCETTNTAETLGDGITHHTVTCVVSIQLVLLPHTIKYSLSWNDVELQIAGLVDPIQISEVQLFIGVVGESTIWSYEGADVIFDMGLDVVFASVAGLSAVFDYLVGLCGAWVVLLVALWVMLHCKHVMTHPLEGHYHHLASCPV